MQLMEEAEEQDVTPLQCGLVEHQTALEGADLFLQEQEALGDLMKSQHLLRMK